MMALLAATAILTRAYWPVDAAVFAASGSVHTHVAVEGWVCYARNELDGDLHIKIVPTAGVTTPFFIAECIPALPCTKPAVNAHVRVRGITRRDPEHHWFELHPVESIEVLP